MAVSLFFKSKTPPRCSVMRADGSVCNQSAPYCVAASVEDDELQLVCEEHAKIMFPEDFGLTEKDVAKHPDIRRD